MSEFRPLAQDPPRPWIGDPHHHRWLAQQTDALLDFYRRSSPDPVGGFSWVDGTGQPTPSEGKQLWINARMTYGFVLGDLLGRPGCGSLAREGFEYLRSGPLHDPEHGGWFWAVGEDGAPTDDSKQAYGHAFVLLAAAAGRVAGFDTTALWDEVLDVLDRRFWEPEAGMFADSWDAGFRELEPYRGQNANMHLVEALLLAAEVDDSAVHLDRAVGIAEYLIRDTAAGNSWRLPEHFDARWQMDPDYGKGDTADVFRPYGSTIGHWLEWSRLLLHLHAATGPRTAWIPDAASTLFERAVTAGWDHQQGGFAFSVDWNGDVADPDRYHWVIAEAIGAAAALYQTSGEPAYDRWYRAFWDFAERRLIDAANGSWIHQLDGHNRPSDNAWSGRPDLYHALQATLFARASAGAGLATQLAAGKITA